MGDHLQNQFKLDLEELYQSVVRTILYKASQNPGVDADHLAVHTSRTPERAAKAWAEFLQGYDADIQKILQVQFPLNAVSENFGKEPIVLRDVDFVSICPHHLLPFFGKVDISYIPDAKIVGISKLAHLINACSRRLQVQENLTNQLCHEVEKHLSPLGVAVKVVATHSCLALRGANKIGSSLVTYQRSGLFVSDEHKWSQFLNPSQ